MEDFEVDDAEPSSHADVGGEEQYENSRNLKPQGRSQKDHCYLERVGKVAGVLGEHRGLPP